MDSESARPDFHSGQGTNRAFYLPRLAREFYQGDAVVHWTMPVAMRGTGWLNGDFHRNFRELMVHVSVREGLFCPAYCLMPDHIHLLWMGLRPDSDQPNGMKFLREYAGRALRPHRFQHQAYDHVLREDERKRDAFAKTCFYILANPVRAGLIGESEKWSFCGAIVPGYPAMHPLEQKFWPLFWKLYFASRSPEAGQRKLPPRDVAQEPKGMERAHATPLRNEWRSSRTSVGSDFSGCPIKRGEIQPERAHATPLRNEWRSSRTSVGSNFSGYPIKRGRTQPERAHATPLPNKWRSSEHEFALTLPFRANRRHATKNSQSALTRRCYQINGVAARCQSALIFWLGRSNAIRFSQSALTRSCYAMSKFIPTAEIFRQNVLKNERIIFPLTEVFGL